MATDRDLRKDDHDSNPDPITGAPGSHPTGAGIGAAAGGATGAGAAIAVGAATGSVVGPVGTAIGVITGAIVGGLIGKGVGEKVDPTEDDLYWRDEYRNRPYYSDVYDYDRDIAPAYRYGSTIGLGIGDDYDRPVRGTTARASDDTIGSTSSNLSTGDASKERRGYDDYESDIRAGWEKVKGKSQLTYEKARDAIRDAFDRRTAGRRNEGGNTTPIR